MTRGRRTKPGPKLGGQQRGSQPGSHGRQFSRPDLGITNELWHVGRMPAKFEANVVRSERRMTASSRWLGISSRSGAPANPAASRSSLTRRSMWQLPPPRKLRTGHQPAILRNRRELDQRRRRHLNRIVPASGTRVDIERRRFATSYGISYTSRRGEPDQRRTAALPAPVSGGTTEKVNVGTTFDHRRLERQSLRPRDYSIDTTSACRCPSSAAFRSGQSPVAANTSRRSSPT